MRHIILASHDDLSKGMKKSAQMILGDLANDIVTYSLYPGQNPQDYVNELAISIENHQDDAYIVMTDVEGGSVNNACVQLARFKNVEVIAGMNLCFVMEILMGMQHEVDKDFVYRSVENAKLGIVYHGNFKIECSEVEDF